MPLERRPRPILSRELDALSVSRKQIRAKGWTNPAYGLHVPPGYRYELLPRCAALQLVLPPDSIFTSLTSALLRDWWLPACVHDAPIIACSREDAPHHDRRGLYVRRCAVPTRQRHVIDHVRVASPARTVLELAEVLSLIDLVVAIDCALHRGDCTLDELLDAVIPGRRGVRVLRRALALCDGRSESAWETILRLLHVLSGIDVTPQYVVREGCGAFVARGDLRIGSTRRLAEYDGAEHRGCDRHRADLRREKSLSRISWERYGYVSPEIHRTPGLILRDAEDALGLPHDPRRVDGWMAEYNASSLVPAGRAALRKRVARFVRAESPRKR